ncbi:MAG: hypothetical protein KKF41_07485 [Actinobacteria bacterium]|nr:hypothetical protein [Actinomycetota bacterium]MBU1942239.1 hypothetical protein [Actinomycetota bacterium]MBU2687412.1 hypothetical protein [Actinomycetota bacterium]
MKRIGRSATVLVLVLVVSGTALLAGCGGSSMSASDYKAQYTGTIDKFESQIEEDDRKANELVAKNDLAAVIALLNQRIKNVDEVFDEIAALRPPAEMRDLQAITLYYLFAVKQQLQAQNNLNDAIRKEEPTTDLVTAAENAKARTQKVTRELVLELEKLGITLKVMEQQPGQQPGSAPASSPAGESTAPQ